MTKTEALELMYQGYKITHPILGYNNWLTIKHGQIHDEEGMQFSILLMKNKFFDSGYKLYSTPDMLEDLHQAYIDRHMNSESPLGRIRHSILITYYKNKNLKS